MTAPLDANATRRHWDALASSYDHAKQRNAAYYSGVKACFNHAIPVANRRRVLEVGCGTGQVLASLCPSQGIGIDTSQCMIDVARRQFGDRPELLFQALDAAAEHRLGLFDAVISADLIEHVSDWRAVVIGMVRSCREGGVIAIATPNPGWTVPLWLLEKARLKMPEGPHRFVHRRLIASTLMEFGCTVLRQSTHMIIPMRLGGLGLRLSVAAQRAVLFRALGVIQMVVASKPG